MTHKHAGFHNEIELPKGSFLFIDDEVPEHPKAKVFDPALHSFNPLRRMTKRKARELSRVIYTGSGEGTTMLTVRNGRCALARAMVEAHRLDKLSMQSRIKGVQEDVEEMMEDVLFTDEMRRVLCSDDDFRLDGRNTKVFAHQPRGAWQ